MPEFPTCWYCPKCGKVGDASLGRMTGHSTTIVSIKGGAGRIIACHGEPVERMLVPIGDFREGWVHEDYGTWWVSPVPEDDHPSFHVFVVRPRGEATDA